MTARRWAGLACVAVATLAALWFVWGFTAAMVTPDPAEAYARWPIDTARTGVASSLVTDHPSPARAAHGEALALATLRHMPVNAEAARDVALGRLATGRYAEARAIVGLGEALSRRDWVAQTWLIEDRVAAGDVAGAVLHYDRALRTTPESRPVLLPVLAQAANEPAVAAALARRLTGRPEWWSDFLGRFVAVGTSPDAFRVIADGLRLDPAADEDRARLGTIFTRLTWLGEIAPARALFDHVTGHREGAVVDGGFDRDPGMAPFGWQLSGSASREPRDGADGAALSVASDEGREAARQLLALPPGRYVLRARTGGVGEGASSPPLVSLACARTSEDPGAPEIASAAFPVGARAWSLPFAVPAGCKGQWLRITSGSGPSHVGEDPWIDDVAVTRQT